MALHPLGPGLGPGPNEKGFNLVAHHQQQYRVAFQDALAAGDIKPLVIPWSFIGSFFLPLLYLSIPHTNRPWLYRMRWAVAAAVVYLNVRVMQTTSAGNEAVAYATGLSAGWGTIWSLRLLIFTRPQWDAARVERRPRRRQESSLGKEKKKAVTMVAPDESVAASLPHNEYFWQPFPATAPFLARLGWTADLFTSFRGAGWNFAIPSIPHPPPPAPSSITPTTTSPPNPPVPVRLDLIPLTSRTGHARSPTHASFLRSRLLHLTLSYLTIDLLTTLIRRDPYFVLCPDYHLHPLPQSSLLTTLPHPHHTLPLLRNTAALAGIIAGLHLYSAVLQLALVFLLPPTAMGVKAELWQHPTLFGGVAASVLGRGLAGFWGGWWHQTFRAGFVAGGRWVFLVVWGGEGLRGGRRGGGGGGGVSGVVEMLLAFLLSGLLHAAGGYTSVPYATGVVARRSGTPVVFFLLQAVGVGVQRGLGLLLRRLFVLVWRSSATTPPIKPVAFPRWVRRAGNLLFTLAWLHFTGWGLIDDMSRAGIWLFEPVPVSPLRMMGLGVPGEKWWRWEGGYYGFGWYKGNTWWESGLRL
jgi:hypothetical protein